jgi:hypothetical protein
MFGTRKNLGRQFDAGLAAGVGEHDDEWITPTSPHCQFAKYQVLPLDASVASRMVTPRPSMSGGRKVFAYSGEPVTGIPRGTAPSLLNTSYTITAEIDVPQGGGQGMIVTDGGRFGGYGSYLLKGKPVFLWNLLDLKRVRWEGKEALPPGKHTIEYGFKYDGLGFATLAFNNISGIGRPGTGTLKVDGKAVSTQTLDGTMPLTLPRDETFDIGSASCKLASMLWYKPLSAFWPCCTFSPIVCVAPAMASGALGELFAYCGFRQCGSQLRFRALLFLHRARIFALEFRVLRHDGVEAFGYPIGVAGCAPCFLPTLLDKCFSVYAAGEHDAVLRMRRASKSGPCFEYNDEGLIRNAALKLASPIGIDFDLDILVHTRRVILLVVFPM